MERLSLSLGALGGEPGGRSFTGDPEGYVEEASGDGHLSPYEPHWGTWKGARIPGTLKKE